MPAKTIDLGSQVFLRRSQTDDKMEGYEVDKAPFYTSPDGCVLAFKGLSKDRSNHHITLIHQTLIPAMYKDQFSYITDEVFSISLEQARTEKQRGLKILEIQVDFKKVPEEYSIFHALDCDDGQKNERIEGRKYFGEEELIEYLQNNALKLAEATQKPLDSYEIEEKAFFENDNVRLYKDLSGLIVVKCHEFSIFRNEFNLSSELAKAINTGLVQARVQHPHICRIIAMYLETSKAPSRYYLDYILEALERDVWREIGIGRLKIDNSASGNCGIFWYKWQVLCLMCMKG